MKRKHYLFVTILIGFFLAACIGFQKPIHAAVITIPMIKELPTLNVAYQTDQPPLSYQNEKGEFAGIVRDVLDRIAQLTGLTFHYIKIPSGVVSNSFYEKNEITLIASVLYNNANRERQELRLTIPYLDMDQVILTPIDFDSNHLTDFILASDRHSDVFWEEHNDNTSPKIHKYNSVKECFRAVYSKKADGLLLNHYVADWYLGNPRYSDMQIIPIQSYREKLSIGLYQGKNGAFNLSTKDEEKILISILDKAINRISKEELNQIIVMNTTKHRYQVTFLDFLYLYYKQLILIVIVLSIFIFLLVSSRQMVAQKNRELEEKNEALEKANQAKNRFLSNVSHEVRTPMNAIVGLTELAKKQSEDENKVMDCLNKIETSSYVLIGIINDILDMSSIENDKLKINQNPFELSKMCDKLFPIYEGQSQKKQLHVKINCNFPWNLVIGDELRVSQILMNLMSNAYKFTSKGGHITIDISQEKKDKEEVWTTFIIQDDGCGMSEHMKQRLFQPFEQERTIYNQSIGGNGLGMSIVRNLTNLMGGHIEVNSERNVGTKVTVVLPFSCAVQDRVNSNREEKMKPSNLSNLSILLVEDNELNAEITKEILNLLQVSVTWALNGQQALDEFKSKPNGTYQLILMDIKMPVMDGYETTKRIREWEQKTSEHIPIYAMSANAFQEDINRAKDVGMDGYLYKPIDTKKLIEVLQKIVQRMK